MLYIHQIYIWLNTKIVVKYFYVFTKLLVNLQNINLNSQLSMFAWLLFHFLFMSLFIVAFSSKVTWDPFLTNICDTYFMIMPRCWIKHWLTIQNWFFNHLDTGCRVSSWSRLGQQGEGENQENCDEHLCCCLVSSCFFGNWLMTTGVLTFYL